MSGCISTHLLDISLCLMDLAFSSKLSIDVGSCLSNSSQGRNALRAVMIIISAATVVVIHPYNDEDKKCSTKYQVCMK